MKKIFILLLFIPFTGYGQWLNEYPATDSTTIWFTPGDSLVRHLIWYGYPAYDSAINVRIDTSLCHLWQIGNTLKPTFSNDTIRTYGIMTDTLHPYPANAHDHFDLMLDSLRNFEVVFWHRYDMDSFHAGGVVEFSTDSGISWLNATSCFVMTGYAPVSNWYANIDSIFSGEPAFTGHSSGEIQSVIDFENELPVRTTSTSCFPPFSGFNFGRLMLRFRFMSDTMVSSKPGWLIDSIRVSQKQLPSGLRPHHSNTASYAPNPTTNSIDLKSPLQANRVEIYDLTGRRILDCPYEGYEYHVDLSLIKTGFYIVKLNGVILGKLLKE